MFLTRRKWKYLSTIYGVFVSFANHSKGNYCTLEWRNKNLTTSHMKIAHCASSQSEALLTILIFPNDFLARFRLRYSTTCNSYYRDWMNTIDPSSKGVIPGWEKALYSVENVHRYINEETGQVTMWNMNLKLSIHNTEPIKYGVSAILCLHNMKKSRRVVDLQLKLYAWWLFTEGNP